MRSLHLKTSELSFRIGQLELFNNLEINVYAGSVVELRGPNGSGKSTLLRILAKLQQPSQGVVTQITQRIGYVGHRLGLFNALTVRENLLWYSTVTQRVSTKPEIKSILQSLDLLTVQDSRVGKLSFGQKRRCALACLVGAKYDLWLLDEPFLAIDRDGFKQAKTLMERHRENHGSIVMATHVVDSTSDADVVQLGS